MRILHLPLALLVCAVACVKPPAGPDDSGTPVASLTVTLNASVVGVGQGTQATATLRDANGAVLGGRAITWASSNTSVATVAADGYVSGLAAGNATIAAASEGQIGSAALTVRTSAPPPPPQPGLSTGIWANADELRALPASGPAWDNLKDAADSDLAGGVLSTRDDHNVRTMAAGLVAARLGSDTYRAKVRESLRGVMAAPINGADPLAILRRLGTYAIAADLVDLKNFDPSFDQQFRVWLDRTRKTPYDGETVAAYHERRPNNWGTHAGVSRIAAALYLGDRTELERAAQVFRGWLGDRTAYAGFTYNDVEWWQADPTKPVGINPKGATREGHSIDGVLPDDQRRAGPFTWPPQKENYIYTALEGSLGQAVLLSRQGYDVWNWSDRALLRAFVWLHEQANYPAEGNDCWQPVIINRVYGTGFPAPASSDPGKNIGWADWTHQR
jgi:hypothetical protein